MTERQTDRQTGDTRLAISLFIYSPMLQLRCYSCCQTDEEMTERQT